MTSMPTAPVILGAAAVLELWETPALTLALGLALTLELELELTGAVVIVSATLDRLENISPGIFSTPPVIVTRTSVMVEKFCNKLLISPLLCSSDPSSIEIELESDCDQLKLPLTTALLDVKGSAFQHDFKLAVNASHVISNCVRVVGRLNRVCVRFKLGSVCETA